MTAKQTTQLKPKARNGKPLMSELLTDARKYIELAEQADIEPLRQFLFNEPERPLIAMGHGGSHSSAAYAALLYGTNCGLGRAITPYQANSLSDATLKGAKLFYYEPNEPVDRNFLRAVAASNIVKFSDEKHPDVSFTEDFTDKLFIQMMNEKGLRFKLRAEGWMTIPPEHNPHAVDGEGAGDWTTSTFINELGHHHMLTFDRIHLPNVTHCLEEALRVASMSVSYIGAKGLIHY